MNISETSLIEDVETRLRQRLPKTWRVQIRREPRGRTRPDALLNVLSPNGTEAIIAIESLGASTARYLRFIMETMRRLATEMPSATCMAVAPYLSPRARDALRSDGYAYADATGNFYLALDEPPVFIEMIGANRDPWPEDKPLQSLRGPGAGKAVRAFCDFKPPYGIRELARRAEMAAPTLSRVADLLEREGVVVRERSRGPIVSVNWAEAIRIWSRDYSFTGSNKTSTWLEPRGIEALEQKLRDSSLAYALTGSLAASILAPVTVPRLAAIYSDQPEALARNLELRPAETGGNVLLAEPFDSVVFTRGFEEGRLRFAACSQVAADLLTGPGRWPAEGEELLLWMAENERTWRT
jgi:hypothetical protein